MIKGIYADEADLLHPDQWVNVYEIDACGRAIYYDSCQVKELDLDYPEEYGNLMSLKEAFNYAENDNSFICSLINDNYSI